MAHYGPKARWSMTERGARHTSREEARFTVGPSQLLWEGDTLVISLEEVAVPVPARIRGTIRVTPRGLTAKRFDLLGNGRHHWQPIAPVADVAVELTAPEMGWCGKGYLDSNRGTEPLEHGFRRWDWARFDRSDGCVVAYDLVARSKAPGQHDRSVSLGLQFGDDGTVAPVTLPPCRALPKTFWRLSQCLRGDHPADVAVVSVFEDVPFYSRNHVRTVLDGAVVDGVHETFDGDRLAQDWVRVLLPFRMPRLP